MRTSLAWNITAVYHVTQAITLRCVEAPWHVCLHLAHLALGEVAVVARRAERRREEGWGRKAGDVGNLDSHFGLP